MIDMNGMEMLEEVAHMLQKSWGWLYFLDLKLEVQKSLQKAWFMKTIGEQYFFTSIKWAIEYIYNNMLDKNTCKKCKNKAFSECWGETFEDYSKSL
jgi:hypothetical protein